MTQLATFDRSAARDAWRYAYPAKWRSVCAFCGGEIQTGEMLMKYSVGGASVYGHSDNCPQNPIMPEPKPAGPSKVDYSAIVGFMGKAAKNNGKGLAYPKIHFASGDTELVFRLTKKGEVQIVSATEFVWNDRFMRDIPLWYGTIDANGKLNSSQRNMTLAIEDELNNWAADAEGMARAYGKLTGNCCFCNRELSDDRSLEVGYGKVCAGHYGLAWG